MREVFRGQCVCMWTVAASRIFRPHVMLLVYFGLIVSFFPFVERLVLLFYVFVLEV